MSLISNIESMSDAELGRLAVKRAVQGISWALMLCSWFYLGWFIALLITILIALVAMAAQVAIALMVSEDSFESVGSTVGRGIGSVMNLFSRKG